MKLIMKSWKKFLKEQSPSVDDFNDMFKDMDDKFSGKESPKIKQFKQRLLKLGISKEEVENFISFEGMTAKRGVSKEEVLEKKIIALEKFANTPIDKLPQRMKVTPGGKIKLMYNRRSWEGQVGDPNAPSWVQTIVPNWQTKNPIYPTSPMGLGLYGKGILFRKLKAHAAKTKAAPKPQQKQAQQAPQQQQQKQAQAATPQQQKQAQQAPQKQAQQAPQKQAQAAAPQQQKQAQAAAPQQQKQAQAAATPSAGAEAPNDVVKKVQSGQWAKGGKSFPKANPEVINLIYKLQGLIGAKQDGVFGNETAKAIRRKYYGE